MVRWRRTFFGVVALTLAVSPLVAGGWAVITVGQVPDQAVAGVPLTLDFSVRQHGLHLVGNLDARVSAAIGGHRVDVKALGTGTAGYYTATLTLPRPGEWAITIHSGFGASSLALAPLVVAAPGGDRPVELSEAVRGQRLFVAKGCVTCHRHEGAATANASLSVGRSLTEMRYPPAYLERLLADPAGILPPQGSTLQMPTLNLTTREIAALVAFINQGATKTE